MMLLYYVNIRNCFSEKRRLYVVQDDARAKKQRGPAPDQHKFFFCLLIRCGQRHRYLSSPASSGASVLSTNPDAPPVPQTTVRADLLHPLNIVTQLGIEILGKDLGVLSGLEVLLSVEEPERDLKLAGVLDNGNELFNFVRGELTSALVYVYLSLFADKVCEATSETLDFGQAKHHIALSFNIGIQNTENVLELRTLH